MASRTRPGALTRRRFLHLVAAGGGLALGGLLAACGGTASDDGAAETNAGAALPPAAGESRSTIVVWFFDDTLKAPLKEFEQAHPNIKVDLQATQGDLQQLVLRALESGSGAPDVFPIALESIGLFAQQGGLLDLSGAPFDGAKLQNDMLAPMWAHGTSEGKLIALPWGVGPGGVWYREDILAAAGFKTEPEQLQERLKTWDDFFQLGQELKRKNAQTSLIAHARDDLFYPMVAQQGHGWVDGSKVLIEEKGSIPAQRVAQARKLAIDDNILSGIAWDRAVRGDRIAGLVTASWRQPTLAQYHPQTAGKWRVIRAPEHDFVLGGLFLSIPAQTKNPEAAWELVKYICGSVEGQNTFFQSLGIFPAYKPAWQDQLYDRPVAFFGGQPVYRLWATIADNMPAGVVSTHEQAANEAVYAEITKVQSKVKDPVQAMRDAEARMLRQVAGLVG